MGLAYISIGLAAASVAGLVYFAFKARGSAESIADARIARAAAEEAQRLTTAELEQEQRVTKALRIAVANRDVQIAGLNKEYAAILQAAKDAGFDVAGAVAARLRRLSGQADAPEADPAAGPVPTWLHRDPDPDAA